MPLPNIIKPQFPNVPDVAGVPQVKRSGLPTIARAVLSGIEGYLWNKLTNDSRWGVFTKDGKLIAQADTVVEVGYRAVHATSTCPVAGGSFATYNKVASPFEATVRLSKGGGVSVLGSLLDAGGLSGIKDIRNRPERLRGEFLDAIDAASKSLDLYHVVTPEKTYVNCNIQEYNYRREQTAGARRIEVELSIIEVREVVAMYGKADVSQIVAPRQPEAAAPVSGGRVQPQEPKESWALKAARAAKQFLGR